MRGNFPRLVVVKLLWCSTLTACGIRCISFQAHYVIKLTSKLSWTLKTTIINTTNTTAIPKAAPHRTTLGATQLWLWKFAWQFCSLAPHQTFSLLLFSSHLLFCLISHHYFNSSSLKIHLNHSHYYFSWQFTQLFWFNTHKLNHIYISQYIITHTFLEALWVNVVCLIGSWRNR